MLREDHLTWNINRTKGESDGTENKDDQSNASSPSDTRGRKIRAKRPSRFKTLSGFITRQPRLKKDPEEDNDLEENGDREAFLHLRASVFILHLPGEHVECLFRMNSLPSL